LAYVEIEDASVGGVVLSKGVERLPREAAIH
jgi:hypothetical protein